MTERIAIVGAGIAGCLIARELLAARPAARVVLIDRDLAGFGASDRSAGMQFPIGRTDRIRTWAVRSREYYRMLGERHPETRHHAIAAVAACRPERAAELRAQCINPGELRHGLDALPGLAEARSDLATWALPGSHSADVGGLVRWLARSLRGRAAVVEGAAAEAVDESSNFVRITLSSGETLEVDRLVLAPGPWANAAPWRALTAELNIRIKKVVAFHIDHPVRPGAAAVLFQEEDAFLAPLVHRGHWLYSYTCRQWDYDPDKPAGGTSRADLDDARAVLGRYAREAARRIRGGRVFCDAYSPAREPIVSPVGQSGRIVFAGAANGSGYRLAPAMAAEAVALLGPI